MATDPRPLEIQQIQSFLKVEFNGAIVGLGTTVLDKERNFLSKALAAYFLMIQAGATKADAVAASIDGGNDHGIDSVYISPTGVLWLVQSKYIHEGKGEPNLGDASKFKDGVLDLIRGQFGRFNNALQVKLSAIQAVMANDYIVKFALAYTGTSLNDDRLQLFGDVEKAVNAIQPGRARFVRFGLMDFHDALVARRAEKAIDLEIELINYGLIDVPARAFFGVMKVRDLAALYQAHDHSLVRANIRRYRGSSRVNAEITRTLVEQPEQFVYFNNGITILCDRITAVGATDPERRIGRFRLEGASIINGAQTAGTVAMQPLAHYDAKPAHVLVTCIQSSGELEKFGDLVTEFRNSQNAVQVQDFIALDDNQENWRKTLSASGITYIYKQSASDPHASSRVFTAQEAANYLAAANEERATWFAGLALAQTSSHALWDRRTNFFGAPVVDPGDSTYGRLFPDSLSARRLWRTTQIGRLVRDAMEADAQTQSAAQAALTNAAVFLVAHIVFIRLKHLTDGVTLMLTQQERSAVSQELDKVRAALDSAYANHDWAGQEPANVLLDPNALKILKGEIMQALNA